MLKWDQGGKACLRISVLWGNVENPVISSDLKLTALFREVIEFLMMPKSQFPRSSLRLKYSLIPNAGHSCAQLSFSGRALRTLIAKIATVVHMYCIRGLSFLALKSGTSHGHEFTSEKGEKNIFFSHYSIILGTYLKMLLRRKIESL